MHLYNVNFLANVFDIFSKLNMEEIFDTGFKGSFRLYPSVYAAKKFFYFLLQYINLAYIMSLEIPKTFKYI